MNQWCLLFFYIVFLSLVMNDIYNPNFVSIFFADHLLKYPNWCLLNRTVSYFLLSLHSFWLSRVLIYSVLVFLPVPDSQWALPTLLPATTVNSLFHRKVDTDTGCLSPGEASWAWAAVNYLCESDTGQLPDIEMNSFMVQIRSLG